MIRRCLVVALFIFIATCAMGRSRRAPTFAAASLADPSAGREMQFVALRQTPAEDMVAVLCDVLADTGHFRREIPGEIVLESHLPGLRVMASLNNRLVLDGTRLRIAEALELIATLDGATATESKQVTVTVPNVQDMKMKAFTLEHASAVEVVAALDRAMSLPRRGEPGQFDLPDPPARFTAVNGNRIVAHGRAAAIAEAHELILQLDVPPYPR